MARAKNTDFLHNFRFAVMILDGDKTLFTPDSAKAYSPNDNVPAGFSSCTTPELTQDAVEYREGHYIYTRKYTGIPTVNTISLARGVALGDGSFWKWIKMVVEQGLEYRVDLGIYHLHRNAKDSTASAATDKNIIFTSGNAGTDRLSGSLLYKVYNAFPTRHKVSTDLDATSAEVSIQELEFAFEYFAVEQTALPA